MKKRKLQRSMGVINALILGLLFLISAPASAAVTSVTPNTWNIIGLDSNTPAFGPNRFPVGADVCSNSAGTVNVAFSWDTGGTTNDDTYIYLRPGSLGTTGNPLDLTFTAAGCLDAYFEVEVNPVSASFDQTRRYHITAGSISTSTPRELYVEHLVSQSRNAIDYFKLDGVSVPAGGAVNLIVGDTYAIELGGHTAPGGYNQIEQFINFPNTIFQVLSVSTTYSSEDSPYVDGAGHPQLHADACRWENDPNSPYYLSCWEDYKAGGTVITTYTVKIISGGGTSGSLNTLIHDFSGSSFHYNSDFSTGARYMNVIDPSTLIISKGFFPDPVNVGGVTTLTFTITNPNPGTVSEINFTDVFPTSPGNMTLASTTTTNTCGGTLTDNTDGGLNIGDLGIKLTGGTVAAGNNCTVQVSVTTDATGTYTNTSNNLFVSSLDTGDTASTTLTVNTTPPPPTPPSACVSPVTLATWSMNDGLDGSSNPNYNGTLASGVSTATASYTGTGTKSIDATTGNPLNSWKAVDGWSNTAIGYPNGGASPYFQFYIDTSNYGGAMVSFDYMLSDNQGWGGTNAVYIYSSANGGGYSNIYSASAIKNSWQNNIAVGAAATTGTSDTSFRINATASNGAKTSDGLYLDNVAIKGCPRPDPPSITKAFSPSPVAVSGTSTLTFTVSNLASNNVAQNYILNGIAFTDTLPSGLTVATGSSSQCGGTLTMTAPDTISFSGGALAADNSCNITAVVTATTAGPHNNVSGTVSATESGANTTSAGIASATLIALSPPTISKLFAPNPILAGGVSTLAFTITNPNQNEALNGVVFSDTFPVAPGAMVVAPTPNVTTSGCGAGAFAPALAGGEASISFSGGTIAAGGICYVTVDITAPAEGDYANTSGNVSHTLSGTWNGNTASDTLTVSPAYPSISVLKQISTSAGGPWTTYIPVSAGTNVYYRFTVENPGDVDLTSVRVDDDQESDGLGIVTVCSPGNLAKYATTTCSTGPVSALSGAHPNTATAYGTYNSTEYPSNESVALYATTGLTITKSATETYFTAAGDVLNYSYVVKNTGSAPLLGPATVADDKSTDESCPAISTATGGIADGDNYLDSNEQITCTATYTVTAADVTAGQVTNTASAAIDGVTSPTDSETVSMAMPSLTVIKSVTAYSDPINGTSGPKAIPGSFMTYTILVTNTGLGQADNSSTVIADPIPADTELFVGDIDGAGSGPVKFTTGDPDCSAGTAASGLCYDYANPGACAGDNIEFSNTAQPGPYTYGYTPTADGNGCDAGVTSLKVTLGGPFNGTVASGGSNTSFCLQFRVRVK